MTLKCKLETCNKQVPKGATKFCCTGHSSKYYQNKLKLERLKQKEQDTTARHCAYTKCGKELPSTSHAQKRYCTDTDCYKKQNSIDNEARRLQRKALKEKKLITCANSNCKKLDNTFSPRSMKKYCCKECRKEQSETNAQKRLDSEIDIYRLTKEKALMENGNKKEIGINHKFTQRGKVHYAGYTTL